MVTSSKESLYCWIALIGLSVNMCAGDGLVRSYGLLFLDFLEMYEQGAFKTGWIATCFSLSTLSLSPVCGYLCDRFPLWWTLTAGGVLGCAAMIATFLASTLSLTIVTWGLGFGMANPLFFTASISATSKMFKQNRSLALGILNAGGAIGAMGFPPLYIKLSNVFGVRGAILIYGGIVIHVLISAVLLWGYERRQSTRALWLKEKATLSRSLLAYHDEENHVEAAEYEFEIISYTEIKPTYENQVITSYKSIEFCDETHGTIFIENTEGYRKSNKPKNGCSNHIRDLLTLRFISVLFYQFGLIFAFYGFMIYVPAYAEEIGLTTNQGSLMLTLSGAADLAGRLAVGGLANLRFTNLHLMLISNLLTGAVMLVILSLFPGLYMFAVSMLVLGLTLGGSSAMLGELVVDAVGDQLAGTGLGIANMGFGGGLSLYPIVNGLIRERVGSYAHAPHLSAAALLLSVLALITGQRGRLCKCSHRNKHERL